MATQIVLLRGINVGSHNRIPMADLRELLSELGYPDARTLLQSGNVVLSAKDSPKRLTSRLEAAIAEKFSVDTRIVVRTRKELAAVVTLDPLRKVVEQDKLYQVSFLSAEPNSEAIQKIASVDVSPERFVHDRREIYAWHPDGIQRSPLANLLTDKRLGVVATARNWNTVGKLLELANDLEA